MRPTVATAVNGDAGPLAALVRAGRMRARLTQGELAVRTGVSIGAIRDIEQGRTVSPRAASVARLAEALGLGGDLAGLVVADRRAGTDRAPGPDPGGRPGLQLAVLGPLAGWRDGVALALGQVRQRAVLGLLALHREAGMSRAAMVDALWGAEPPPAAVAMLQRYVSRLRRVLGPDRGSPGDPAGDLLSWDGTGYRLAARRMRCDVGDFDDQVAAARRAATDGDARQSCCRYERALGLWRGAPLGDLEILHDYPAVTELGRRRVGVVIEYADAAASAGVHGRALDQLQATAELEPLDERVHARLMIALTATGQQAAALRHYEGLRLRLDRELGVRPGPELADAHIRMLREEIPVAAVMTAGIAGGRAPAAPLPRDAAVPRQLPVGPAHFTGRAAELAVLDDLIDRVGSGPSAVVIAAICGTAGVGKTALAVSWAQRVADRFPDGQLYINLRGYGPHGCRVRAAEAIGVFLDALRVPADEIPASADARAGRYRSLMAGRRMLIVLDNARDAEQVRPLLPGNAACLVVVTSRDHLAGLTAAEGAYPVTLGVLTDADAHALLARRLGQSRLADGRAARQLAALCARLPLALCVAAAHAARHPGFPLRHIVAKLHNEPSLLDALETGDPASGLRAVLSWSYDGLSEPAARLFRLLSVHPGADITGPAAASLTATTLAEARRALGDLTRASLLTEAAPDRFACHDLLLAYAAELAQARDGVAELRAARRRILDHYLHTCLAVSGLLEPTRQLDCVRPAADGVSAEQITDLDQACAWVEAERQALVAATTQASRHGFDGHAWQIPWAMECLFYHRGWWHDLRDAGRIAVAAATRSGDRLGQAHALRALGRTQATIGSFGQGSGFLSLALRHFEDLGDVAGRAQTLLCLAVLLGRHGRHREALGPATAALDLFRGAGHRAGQARALNDLACLHVGLGDYERALACGQQAVRLFRGLGDRRGEAAAMDSLGWAHHHLGHHADALAYCREALATVRAFDDRLAQAEILTNLGDTHHAVGEDGMARDMWAEALAALGERSPVQAGQLRARLDRPA